MIRVYKRKSTGGQCSKEAMNTAVEAVVKKDPTVDAAAIQFGMPKITVPAR
jgi:hypothetical protein